MRLFTPGRLKAMEAAIIRTADRLIEEIASKARCELVQIFGIR